jgi:hypothetical protein
MSALTRRVLWIGGASVFLAWMIWFFRADELILEEPAGVPILPFGIQEDLKLARGWGPFDRGSLRLACTLDHELRLVIQTRLPSRDMPGQGRPRGPEAIAAELAAADDIEAVLCRRTGNAWHEISRSAIARDAVIGRYHRQRTSDDCSA